LERIALEQSHPKLTEGELGLVILEHKCRAQIKKLLCGWHPQLKKKIKNNYND